MAVRQNSDCAPDPPMTETNPFTLKIYPEDHKHFGPCECCGEMTSRVWGYVESRDATVAAYFVEWTPGHEEDHANFDLIVGKWGEGTESSDRRAASLEFRKFQGTPSFMVIDATSRDVSHNSLISKALLREEIVGNPVASQVFAICDVIFLDDPRLPHLRS
jgi:hypothetical protein